MRKLFTCLFAFIASTTIAWADDIAVDGKLPGAFSISATQQVWFAQGNLQYVASTDTWSFATNQYDYIGNAPGNTTAAADRATQSDPIDLFGWGTGNDPTKISTNYNDDYPTFDDWGIHPISNGGNTANAWRTLSKDDLSYLILKRTNAANLVSMGSVNGVNGAILLPDDWTGDLFTGDLVSMSGGYSVPSGISPYELHTYTAAEWEVMADNGAVFFPAAGRRNGTNIEELGITGYYWSSSPVTTGGFANTHANYFLFNLHNLIAFNPSFRHLGRSVRLVSETAPPLRDANITAHADPNHAGVYYSTFFRELIQYVLPAGVEAYVASVNGEDLVLSKIADPGQVIPKNTAVILKSSVASYTLSPSEATPVSFTATNSLIGSDFLKTAPANCYVLSGKSSDNSVTGVGFYLFTGTLGAHKAYITLPSGQNNAPQRLRFVFDEEQTATGIESQKSKVESRKILRNGQLVIERNGVEYNVTGQMRK